jgi:NAD-dependent DNA ligase
VCADRAVAQGATGWWPSTSAWGLRDALPFDIDGVVYKVDAWRCSSSWAS